MIGFTTLRVLCIIAVVFAAMPAGAGQVYEVYLLAGQSNMDGRGKTADLDEADRKLAGDAIIFYRNPPAASAGWQPLAPGFSVPPGYKGGLPAPTFGPEIGFAKALAKARPGIRIALIKSSKGGTSLAKDWTPGIKGKPQTQGPCYRNFIETIEQATTSLKDRGDAFAIKGMLWHQGESDAGSTAAEYQERLTAFIARVREDLRQPDLPIVIGEVFDNGKRDSIRTAQRAAAAAIPGVRFVPATDLKTWDAGTHFDAASQLELGRRFAEAVGE